VLVVILLSEPHRARYIALTGEGSHQLTANDIGAMGRFGANVIVFVLKARSSVKRCLLVGLVRSHTPRIEGHAPCERPLEVRQGQVRFRPAASGSGRRARRAVVAMAVGSQAARCD
jgi:hypothetical protein